MAQQAVIAPLHSSAIATEPHARSHTEPEAQTEANWLRRASQGDIAAFDWLMARYRDRALRLAAHVLRRPAEAEDVVQEAFLRAFAQIRSFRSDSSFYTWLYRIVVRICLNKMRSPFWRNSAHSLSEYMDWSSNENTASQTETRALVESLLDGLSPPLRATLVLREIIGLEYEEIAETLEIPVGTVRSRLNAARAQFRIMWLAIQKESGNV